MDLFIQESINAREKLEELVEVVQSGKMSEIGGYIDSLNETECKWMLKMISYGSWKDFDEKGVY